MDPLRRRSPSAPGRWHERRAWMLALGILATAAILRATGIDWGLPQVYEEATPLKSAWTMWGWGTDRGIDFNPHFFNYPSLTIYLQFALQGILYLVLHAVGRIENTIDYQVLYIVDKTAIYVVGRSATALFGVLSVWLLFVLGRRTAGDTTGLIAALLLAVHTFHIAKCQVVEVDVPLTFLCVLSLLLCILLLDAPSWKNQLIAGASVGLAISSKYTGAFLVVPLIVAGHLGFRGASRGGRGKAALFSLVALAAAGGAFVVTSPYVLLDVAASSKHVLSERAHMREGHFGLETVATPLFYARSLAGPLLGWPVVIAAVAGLIQAARNRERWALVLASFALPYLVAVSSWSMKADRYLMPVLPVALLFAAAGAQALLERRRLSRFTRAAALALAVIILAAPLAWTLPGYLRSLRTDPRTEAKQWIEEAVPSGAYIVEEAWGPDLFGAKDLAALKPVVRKRIRQQTTQRVYALQSLPMLQVNSTASKVFYDPSLYEDADVIITTGAVRSRYEADPERFADQLGFYRWLEDTFVTLKVFSPRGTRGSTISIYRNPAHERPFAMRKQVAGPHTASRPDKLSFVQEVQFYNQLGANYEMFGHTEPALECYRYAFTSTDRRHPGLYNALAIAITRCLLDLRRSDEAVTFLERAAASAPTTDIGERLRRMQKQISPPSRR